MSDPSSTPSPLASASQADPNSLPAGVFDDLFDNKQVFDAQAAPVLLARGQSAFWITAEGQVAKRELADIRALISQTPPLVLHSPSLARRLNLPAIRAGDVLELFAFVRPASFVSPTIGGFAKLFDLEVSTKGSVEDQLLRQAELLRQIVSRLLAEAAASPDSQLVPSAWMMARHKWIWAPSIMLALGERASRFDGDAFKAMRVWEQIEPWEDDSVVPKPGTDAVSTDEARAQLSRLLGARVAPTRGSGDQKLEQRQQQVEYAAASAMAFAPRMEEGAPNLVLAEAGTGVGKTLGYLAPASVWAAKNQAPVWISTYTRNLQRQIDQELDRLFDDPMQKHRHVVVRKGRENYLCLLNYQEAALGSAKTEREGQGLVLMARWLQRTQAGDLEGGDLPGWMVELFGARNTSDLSDHRGECLYAACAHYNKCFIEKNVRAAKHAKIVVANHALVLAQADGADESLLPTHYVFDEGHHLFDAADSAFSANFTGLEGNELRRWLLGPEERNKARGRGLSVRLEDVMSLNSEFPKLLQDIEQAANCLPSAGWYQRLVQNAPQGPGEYFLSFVGEQVYARNNRRVEAFSIECAPHPPVPGMIAAAKDLAKALEELLKPIRGIKRALLATLESDDPLTQQAQVEAPSDETPPKQGFGLSPQ